MSIIAAGGAHRGSVRGFYPKVINGSLRFNDDDSPYLDWTPASAGNRKTFTISCWVKRGNLGTNQEIFNAGLNSGDGPRTEFRFKTDNTLVVGFNPATTTWYESITSAVFRDVSAWYHLVVSVDMTQSTSTDRLKLYVNGELQSFSSYSVPSQNTDLTINNTVNHSIGVYGGGNRSSAFLDGYLAEFHFTDGTAYDADAFGEFKNGVWVAKTPEVTYGTNGFYLNFQDDTAVEAFNTVLYRGNGGTQSITGMGFQPDLVWTKQRNGGGDNALWDNVRGATKRLVSNSTGGEATISNGLLSFDSDGFTMGNQGGVNGSGNTYVAWGWKAGDSNVSNTDGSITSTVRANPDYGFSIVSYTGNQTASQTVGHGLNSAPDFIIVKSRNEGTSAYTGQWDVYHSSARTASNRGYLVLNATDPLETGPTNVFDSEPTDTVFGIGTAAAVNYNTHNFIAYCFHSVEGYSKFGSYSGGTNPQTITTNFKPSMIIIKSTTSAENWRIVDNTRDSVNPQSAYLWPNSSSVETNGAGFSDTVTFTDTGFTLTSGSGEMNQSGQTYVYAAFADTREAAFWLDQSGNDNDWQPVNLDHNDTVADSPTNNFATLNPLNKSSAATLSDGNLRISQGASQGTTFGTIGVNSGKYYFEVTINTHANEIIGVVPETQSPSLSHPGSGSNSGFGYDPASGRYYEDNLEDTGHATAGTGDVVMFAIDLDSSSIWVGVNGVWNEGDPSAGTGSPYTGLASGTTYFAGTRPYNADLTFNFGQQPFKYDPPA